MSSQTSCRLIDLSDSEAATQLAKIAHVARLRKQVAGTVKFAADKPWYNTLFDSAKKHTGDAVNAFKPALTPITGYLNKNKLVADSLRNAGIAAGVGAGIGGFASLTGDEEKRKNWLYNMTTGALAGAAVGGGGTYALGKVDQVRSTPSVAPVDDSALHAWTYDDVAREFGKEFADELAARKAEFRQTRGQYGKTQENLNKSLFNPVNISVDNNYALPRVSADGLPKTTTALNTVLGVGAIDAGSTLARVLDARLRRNMPLINLNPDAFFSAAQAGKFDTLAAAASSGGGRTAATALAKLVAGLKTGGLNADVLRNTLVAARSTGQPQYIPGIGVISAGELAKLTEATGAPVQGAIAGTLSAITRAGNSLMGRKPNYLERTGFAISQDPKLNSTLDYVLSKVYNTKNQPSVLPVVEKLEQIAKITEPKWKNLLTALTKDMPADDVLQKLQEEAAKRKLNLTGASAAEQFFGASNKTELSKLHTGLLAEINKLQLKLQKLTAPAARTAVSDQISDLRKLQAQLTNILGVDAARAKELEQLPGILEQLEKARKGLITSDTIVTQKPGIPAAIARWFNSGRQGMFSRAASKSRLPLYGRLGFYGGLPIGAYLFDGYNQRVLAAEQVKQDLLKNLYMPKAEQ